MKTILPLGFAFALILNFLYVTNVSAQLSGTYTIDNSTAASSTNYQNFTSAANDLNGLARTDGGPAHGPGAAANVTFNVKAGDVFNESPVKITYVNSSAFKIIFQKSGAGANPVLQGTNGTGADDTILTIAGGDYYKFDGIDFKDNPANTTANTRMEFGFALNGLAADGCNNDTLKNSVITLNKLNANNTICVSMLNNSSIAAGTNNNNGFISNTLQNALGGYYFQAGFTSFSDKGNAIGKSGTARSLITNIGTTNANHTFLSYQGVAISNQENFTITHTCLDNFTHYDNTGAAGYIYGINVDINTFDGDINNDTIQNFSVAPGSTGVGNIVGYYIDNGGASSPSTINFNNNIVRNFNSSIAGGYVFGVLSAPVLNRVSSNNIYNNLISNLTCTKSGSSYVAGVQIIGGTLSIYGNTISTLSAGTDGVIGINLNGGMTGAIGGPIHDNVISDLSSIGGTVTGILQGWSFFFIPQSVIVSNNSVSNLTSDTNPVIGITLQGSSPLIVNNNKVFNLSSTSSAVGNAVTGVSVASAPSGGNHLIYNNMVYDLKANSATTTAFYSSIGGNVVGIRLPSVADVSNGFIQFYYNTIYLNGVATSSSQTSAALVIRASASADTGAYDIVNNILDNNYTGGNSVALWYNNLNNIYTGISSASDNNLIYAGTPSANHLLFYGKGADSIQTLSAFKTRLSPRGQNTLSANPLFVSATSPINVHIQAGSPASSAGIMVGGITTDIEGNTRPGGGSTPDIGADEITATGCIKPTAGNITATRDTICEGSKGNLTLNGSSGSPITWQSSTLTGTFSDAGASTTSYITPSLTKTMRYRVVVGIAGCSDTTTIHVLVVPDPLVAKFTFVVSGRKVTFNSSTSQGNIVAYSWAFADGGTSTLANPVHTYNNDSVRNVCLTIYDGSSCSYSYCADVLPTGIANVMAQTDWNVYPNPMENTLNIGGNSINQSIEQVEIYDMLGKMVISKTLSKSYKNTVIINVAELPTGMYYLKLTGGGASYIQKIVKN